MKILIAGGSGLIGRALSSFWVFRGHKVCILTRSPGLEGHVRWDPQNKTIHTHQQFDVVVNLAGAGIVDHRWTKKYKNHILQSRIDSIETLDRHFQQTGNLPQIYINAGAIGIYGHHDTKCFNENAQPGHPTFLQQVCVQWEEAVGAMKAPIPVRHIVRIGVVLSHHGGAFPKMTLGKKWGIVPILGNGNQYVSWIHISDLLRIFDHLLTQDSGIYNGVSPNPVVYKEFAQKTLSVFGGVQLTPKIPKWLMHMTMGQRSEVMLSSTCVRPQLLMDQGFAFDHSDLKAAIQDLKERGA